MDHTSVFVLQKWVKNKLLKLRTKFITVAHEPNSFGVVNIEATF